MSDTFEISCPDCGTSRPAKREFIGRAVKCSCGARFAIPDPSPSIAAEFKARNSRRWIVTVSLITAVAGSIAGLRSVLSMAEMATFKQPVKAVQERSTAKSRPAENRSTESDLEKLKRELEEQRARTRQLELAAAEQARTERQADIANVRRSLQSRAAAKEQPPAADVLIRPAPQITPQSVAAVSDPVDPLAGLPVAGPDDEFVPLYEIELLDRKGLPYGWMYTTSVDIARSSRTRDRSSEIRVSGCIGLVAKRQQTGVSQLFRTSAGSYLTELPDADPSVKVDERLDAWVWGARSKGRVPVHVVALTDYTEMRFFRNADEARDYKKMLDQQSKTPSHLELAAFYVLP